MGFIFQSFILKHDTLNIGGVEQVIFFFTVYSFLGWLIENGYSKVTTGVFLKAGFLFGPFKPMYGIAPITLLFLISEETHRFVVVTLCFIVPTMVEYVTAEILYRLFRQKWWDYSHHPYQLNGFICLPFSLCWLILSLAGLYLIHPLVISVYNLAPVTWYWLSILFILYFVADVLWSIRRSVTMSFPTVIE